MKRLSGRIMPLLALLCFISVVFVCCEKNVQSSKPKDAGARVSAIDVSNVTAPPVDPPAIITKVCAGKNAAGTCTTYVYQAIYRGITLTWPGNTNFVYEKYLIGVPVGAPLPAVGQGFSTLVSGDNTPAPFGSIILTNWVLGTLCINNLTGQTNRFNQAVADYNAEEAAYEAALKIFNNSHVSGSTVPSQPIAPEADEYIHDNTACGDVGSNPHISSIFACKLVVYNYDVHGNPIFAVVPLSWWFTGAQI